MASPPSMTRYVTVAGFVGEVADRILVLCRALPATTGCVSYPRPLGQRLTTWPSGFPATTCLPSCDLERDPKPDPPAMNSTVGEGQAIRPGAGCVLHGGRARRAGSRVGRQARESRPFSQSTLVVLEVRGVAGQRVVVALSGGSRGRI